MSMDIYETIVKGVTVHYFPIDKKPIRNPQERVEVEEREGYDGAFYLVSFRQEIFEERGIFRKTYVYEGPRYLYLGIDSKGVPEWTNSYYKAESFSTKEDAEKALSLVKVHPQFDANEVVGLF